MRSTVLRDGLTVARGEAAGYGPSGAVEAMVGEVDLTVTRQAFDEEATEAAMPAREERDRTGLPARRLAGRA